MAIDYKEYAKQLRENAVKDNNGVILCSPELWEEIASIIDNIPTADVEEVKHGEWIYNTDDFTPKMRCSVCGYNKPLVAGEITEQEPNDYCNKCGAKMDGGNAE